jgi:protoporphyrinogen/coproporphyrinogen III oxidase
MCAARDDNVIVCGAGLTGLVTAWHLQQQGVRVTVLEAEAAVGGVMQTTSHDGFLVEHGPNSCTLTAEIQHIVHALDLDAVVRNAAPDAQRRFIVHRGILCAMPGAPMALVRSPLLSIAAKLRLLVEPFIGRYTGEDDESVAAFARRRLGTEVLTSAFDPFVSGVYAGDPEQLSVRHAFPRLAALEREHGSIVRGAMHAARRTRLADTSDGAAAPRHTMISFADGMATLPRRLAASLASGTILHRARVRAIASHADGCAVTVERDGTLESLRAATIVSTLPLHALQHVALPQAAEASVTRLASVRYPAVASLALGFRRSDVRHALDGFGCLIPSVEDRRTLGILFSSTLFDDRAPADQILLTCFTGGTRHPELGTATMQTLRDVLLPELRALLGITGLPTFAHHAAWPHAIPQFERGYDSVLAAADDIERSIPGLLVDGQFRRGVSVGDCVAAGATIAARVTTMLGTPATPASRRLRITTADGASVAVA